VIEEVALKKKDYAAPGNMIALMHHVLIQAFIHRLPKPAFNIDANKTIPERKDAIHPPVLQLISAPLSSKNNY
jgi:hypothetical protein